MRNAVLKSTNCLAGAARLRRCGRGAALLGLTMVLGLLAMSERTEAQSLRVLRLGLGEGTIMGTGITCGTDCNESFTGTTSVDLTAAATAGSIIDAWGGDCNGIGTGEGTANGVCTVNVSSVSSVRVNFVRTTRVPDLTLVTPSGIRDYLMMNTDVDTPEEFIAALPLDYRQNWLLMVRSESLQTGTATSPRILMPGQDSRNVFTVGMTLHSSYPGSHPNAIEYMEWDDIQKNFRFHEIALTDIDPMGDVVKRSPGQPDELRIKRRPRGVSEDDPKCFACHSTRNVLNDEAGATPGTDGIPPGSVGSKNKPNWDTYDSWGGMLAFNRDRLYQGSVEVAAFRKLFNLWTWQGNDRVRAIMEQLVLQPPGIPSDHEISRDAGGGANDGHISFVFDGGAIISKEPAEPLSMTAGQNGSTNYQFDGAPRTGSAPGYPRDGSFVTMHHSTFPGCFGGCSAGSDEGRGVDLFDELFGALNPQRVADEVADHRFATGSIPFDVKPFALAVAQGCFAVSPDLDIASTQVFTSTPALSPTAEARLTFFNQRHAIANFDELYDDTALRQAYLTLRKADLQRMTLDRTFDPYAYDANRSVPPPPPALVDGLVQAYGADTEVFNPTVGPPLDAAGMLQALRSEIFRRTPANNALERPDITIMGGVYSDREVPSTAPRMALYRYFLEPFGVSVDKWSIAVRGRSRTYTMADVFMGIYDNALAGRLKADMGLTGLGLAATCVEAIRLIENSLDPTVLPDAAGPGAMPKFTDIQRIFNKNCIECHGGLGYPPYQTYRPSPPDPTNFDLHEIELNFAENEEPAAIPGERRLSRSWRNSSSNPSYLLSRITDGGLLDHPYNPDEPYTLANPDDLADPDVLDERCPNGLMPCGGPPLSRVDTETFRRWAAGGATYSEGDPHIKTVDGVNYDLQTAGEFVLLREEGFELQARHTPVTTAGPLRPNAYTGLSTCVSLNTAVALRIDGQRVTYQPSMQIDPSDEFQRLLPGALVLRVDGKPIKFGTDPIALASGGRIRSTTAEGGLQIEHPGGTIVVVTPGFWAHHQIWYMNINVRQTRATDGIMGSIAPGNWLPALADGSHLGSRPDDLGLRYQQIYRTFADSWRVDDASSLFDRAPGLTTASFTDLNWPEFAANSCVAPPVAGGSPNSAPVAVARAEAEEMCAEVVEGDRKENCVADVAATGEAGFAATYGVSEALERNAQPTEPTLGLPSDFADNLSQPVSFTWTRSADDELDGVNYRFCLWNSGELFSFNKCTNVAEPRVTKESAFFVGIALFVWLLLLVVLYLTILRRRPGVLILIAILLMPVFYMAFQFGRSQTLMETAMLLDPTGRYYWKVVAEDEQGAIVQSATRHFTVR